MKTDIPATPPELSAPQGELEANLVEWITDPRTAEYFGGTYKLRAAALAAVITGGNLAEVARLHGVTRAAISKSARRYKAIFGNVGLPVD